MLTIREEIKKNEQKSDKTYNVKLRFTLNRRYKRISTSLFVTPKDLTKELQGIDISRANKYVQRKRNAIHLYARVPYIYIKRQTTLIDGLPRCSVYFVIYEV